MYEVLVALVVEGEVEVDELVEGEVLEAAAGGDQDVGEG